MLGQRKFEECVGYVVDGCENDMVFSTPEEAIRSGLDLYDFDEVTNENDDEFIAEDVVNGYWPAEPTTDELRDLTDRVVHAFCHGCDDVYQRDDGWTAPVPPKAAALRDIFEAAVRKAFADGIVSANCDVVATRTYSRAELLEVLRSAPEKAPETSLDEKAPATVFYVEHGSEWAHDGPGWYYSDDNYPDEGTVGAFASEEEAVSHAKSADYVVTIGETKEAQR